MILCGWAGGNGAGTAAAESMLEKESTWVTREEAEGQSVDWLLIWK